MQLSNICFVNYLALMFYCYCRVSSSIPLTFSFVWNILWCFEFELCLLVKFVYKLSFKSLLGVGSLVLKPGIVKHWVLKVVVLSVLTTKFLIEVSLIAGTLRLTFVILSTIPQFTNSYALSRFTDLSYIFITYSSSSIFLTFKSLSFKD